MLPSHQLQEAQKKNRSVQVVAVLLSFPFLQLLTNQTNCKILNQMCNFQFQHKPIAAVDFFYCEILLLQLWLLLSFFFFFFWCVIYFFLLVFWVKKKNCILGEEEDLKKRQDGDWRKRKDI